jgi:hypothetical protein
VFRDKGEVLQCEVLRRASLVLWLRREGVKGATNVRNLCGVLRGMKGGCRAKVVVAAA